MTERMQTVVDGHLRSLADQAVRGRDISRDQAHDLIRFAADEVEQLIAAASQVRRRFFGAAVRMCSIVPGKLGGCGEDCAWCAQSHRADSAAGAQAVHTSCADICTAAGRAVAGGAAGRFGIVNSGRRPTAADLDAVIDALGALADGAAGDLKLCASLGAIDANQARRLADAGVSRYHHNLETSRRMFARMVSTHTYEDRLATLAAAREAGMGICCGGLFGLGETWADRVDLALTVRDEVAPDCVPVNFLQPIPGTPMAERPPLEPPECLAIIAIFRLVLPTTDVKVAGGREFCLRDQQHRIFDAGATSCMTGGYLTTSGQDPQADLEMVQQAGFEIVQDLPAAR